MPMKKSRAFPSAKRHYRMAGGWQGDFVVLHSRANEQVYRSKREFFDRPVYYQPGQNTNKTGAHRAMEVYHKITPVRSIQQSINLIRSLKNEQKYEVERVRPKSVVHSMGSASDTYGHIPNLRESSDKARGVFLPVKRSLKKLEQ